MSNAVEGVGRTAARDIKVRVLEPSAWTYSFADWAAAITFAKDQAGLVQVEQPSQGRYLTIQGGVVTMTKGDTEVDPANAAKARRRAGTPFVPDAELHPAASAAQVFVVKQGRTTAGLFLLRCCAERTALRVKGTLTVAHQPDTAQALRMDIDNGGCICHDLRRSA